jgi:PAS domain S-box-containing protein
MEPPSKEGLETSLAGAPFALYTLDFRDHRDLCVSSVVARNLGYTTEEIQALGDNLAQQVVHPDDLQRLDTVREHGEARTPRETVQTELRLRHADGTWHLHRLCEIPFQRTPGGGIEKVLGLC